MQKALLGFVVYFYYENMSKLVKKVSKRKNFPSKMGKIGFFSKFTITLPILPLFDVKFALRTHFDAFLPDFGLLKFPKLGENTQQWPH
jgi:hypothetical protein